MTLDLTDLPKITNDIYIPLYENKSRYLIIYGGAGSGKSRFIAQKILARAITAKHRFLIVRKVASTLRASVYQLFKDYVSLWQLSNYCQILKSELKISFLNGSELLFVGLDDVEKLKSIEGVTGIWIEEASELTESDFMQLDLRLRGNTQSYKQIIISFNPISHLHWLKKTFIDNPPPDTFVIKTTYKDNRYIDDEYVRVLENMQIYNLQHYNIYALGEWGVLNNNIIYHNYKPDKHITYKTVDDFSNVLYFGIDFNIGGCVQIIAGLEYVKDKGRVLHIVKTNVSYDTDAIVADSAVYKQQKIACPDATGSKRTTNSAQSDIATLKNGGFIVLADDSNPPVRDRINSVNKAFAEDRILINPNTCQSLILALQTHVYKADGTPEKFTEHKGGSIDDWCDGMGYLIYRLFPIHGKSIIEMYS